MKFLVDEMLQRLGRWLRAAGYDTLIEHDGREDYQLLKQAVAEQRLLLTCDQKLTEYRSAKGTVILLNGDDQEQLARQLSDACQLDWLFKPFSRCMVCNTELRDATAEERNASPADVSSNDQAVYYCPGCKKVYWDGSHVQRMRQQLEKWHQQYNQ